MTNKFDQFYAVHVYEKKRVDLVDIAIRLVGAAGLVVIFLTR
nr:hypothetical protein [Variovorax paradoxus]